MNVFKQNAYYVQALRKKRTYKSLLRKVLDLV